MQDLRKRWPTVAIHSFTNPNQPQEPQLKRKRPSHSVCLGLWPSGLGDVGPFKKFHAHDRCVVVVPVVEFEALFKSVQRFIDGHFMTIFSHLSPFKD